MAGRGLCEALWQACLGVHEIVVSDFILQEFEEVLERKLRSPASQIQEALSVIRYECRIVVPLPVPLGACRDEGDCAVLGTAVAADADVLVSGDKDLLVIGAYEGIPILSPRDLYQRLK